jgi:hypothetical protein
MTVWWAKPTLNDIAAQRAMLERGEEKRKADWKQAERERLRDTFAAAALTGLLSLNRPGLNQQFPTELCERAFRWADAMLREQDRQSVGVAEKDSVADRKSVATPRACARSCSQPFDSAPTTHDAVPEARAEYELKEPNGSSTGEPGGEPESTVRTGNTPQPRNGSLSGCETVQQEPVAFAVVCKEMTRIDVYDDAYDAAEYATVLNRKGWTANVVRLVPQSSPTLTDEEREAIEQMLDEASGKACAESWVPATLRSLLERLK